jgi:hypothetical protein
MADHPNTVEDVELSVEQLEDAAGAGGNTWTGTLTLTSDTTIGTPAAQRSIIAI